MTRIHAIGVIVALPDRSEGLIHISELANHNIGHPREVVAVGERIKAVVLHFDTTSHMFALSRKRAMLSAAFPDSSSHHAKTNPSRVRRLVVPILISLLLTPLCMALAIASVGTGHGGGRAKTALYPYVYLLDRIVGNDLAKNESTALFLMGAEFPLYGLAIGIAWAFSPKGDWKFPGLVAFLIAFGHGIAVSMALRR